MEDQDKWRVVLIDEIIQSKYDEIEVPGFDSEELSDILNFACKSWFNYFYVTAHLNLYLSYRVWNTNLIIADIG